MAKEERTPAPRYIAINRNQQVLQPLDVDRLIDEDHAARKIWRVVEQLDLSRFESETLAVEGAVGRPSHSPQVLVSVWLYAYSKGLHSAREIARQMEHEPGLEWLTGLRPINHHTLSDFRVGHGPALQELFEQVLAILTMKGLITLERVAVDGTKIRADVNKKSYWRYGKIEAHLEMARGHLRELAKQEREEQTTKREAAARQRVAREQEQRLAEALAQIERLRAAKKRDKRKEPQASTTDPDASFMWINDGGLAPAYNVQITADAAHGLIADVEVVNDPQDGQQIAPAMDRLLKRDGRYPQQVLADGGYTNNASVAAMDERAIDYYSTWTGRNEGLVGRAARRHEDYRLDRFGYDEESNEMICPEGKRLFYRHTQNRPGAKTHVYKADAETCGPCPARQACCPELNLDNGGRSVSTTIHDASIERFDEKMKRPEALAVYKQRAPLVEFPNAWIKQKLKLRRFATRGLSKVRCEALWAAMTFNLQRMFRLAPA
jgi:transposase